MAGRPPGPRPAEEVCWLQADLIATVVSYMELRGWTAAELARRAGLTQKHVSHLLSGRMTGPLETWSNLLEILMVMDDRRFPVARFGVLAHRANPDGKSH